MPIENDSDGIQGEPSSQAPSQPPLQPPNQNPPAGAADGNREHNESETAKLERQIKAGEGWLIGIGVATLIINTAIALIYYGQLRQMKKATKAATESANLSREALTSVQRAFVFVTTFDVTRLYRPDTEMPDGSMRIAFQWENGGNTPTKDMSTHISVRWFPRPLPDNFSFSDYPKDDPSLKMFVGPKAVNRAAPIVVSARDIMAIHNHSGHLYFWGWAKYHDVFPDSPEHITRFCYELTDVIGDFPAGTINLQTASCRHGNCADDECKAQ